MDRWKLAQLYRKSGISYRLAGSTWRLKAEEVDTVAAERVEFARKLREIKEADEPLCYFDESGV